MLSTPCDTAVLRPHGRRPSAGPRNLGAARTSRPWGNHQPAGGRAMATLAGSLLEEIERTAIELARVAGAEIETALGRVLAVRYKGDGAATTDPVSEVDHHVEVVVRARLGERFPDHAIIGEEIDEGAAEARELTWVVDPIDGTANFVNGFPPFSPPLRALRPPR